MGRHSKAIGAFAGSLFAVLAGFGVDIAPDIQAQVHSGMAIAGAIAGTWLAPQNKG